MGQTVAVPSARPCSRCHEWGDQEYNTVKVDITKLSLPSSAGKENVENQAPENFQEQVSEEEKRQILEESWERETIRRHQEWEEKQRRSHRQRQLMEQEQQEQRRRQLEMQADAMRREKEEEDRKKTEELRSKDQQDVERRQREIQAVEEANARKRDQEEAGRKQKLQEAQDKQRIQSWLRNNGFAHCNDLQRKRFTKVRPLHMAVQNCDPETAVLLLKAGADRNLTSSKRETPAQLALRLNKDGSHDAVVAALTPPQQ